MEFELLHHTEAPDTPLEALRRYLLNPRQQMQIWGENPPFLLGLAVLVVAALELAIGQRVTSGAGGSGLLSQAAFATGALMFAEFVVIAAASSIAGLFEKTGRPLVALTYLNLELTPLLLWLPFSLLAEAKGWSAAARGFVLAALIVRVFSRWREILQLVFRLTRLQTYAAVYGAVMVTGSVCAAFLYVAVLSGVLSLLRG